MKREGKEMKKGREREEKGRKGERRRKMSWWTKEKEKSSWVFCGQFLKKHNQNKKKIFFL